MNRPNRAVRPTGLTALNLSARPVRAGLTVWRPYEQQRLACRGAARQDQASKFGYVMCPYRRLASDG
jgi:hypothetical protein